MKDRPQENLPSKENTEQPDDLESRLHEYEEAYYNLGFPETVARLRMRQDEEYGRGTHASAFKVAHPHGDVIVRMPHVESGKKGKESLWYQGQVLNRVVALDKGRGVEGFEQIIAFSPEDEVVVTDFIPGSIVDKLSAAQINTIDTTRLKYVARVLDNGLAAGIQPDSNGYDNCIYTSEDGFKFIDYWDSDNLPEDAPQGLTTTEKEFVRFIEMLEINASWYSITKTHDENMKDMHAWLSVFHNAEEVCAELFPEATSELSRIQTATDNLKEKIASSSRNE